MRKTAARLKEDWDVVTRPEGRPPYFARAGGEAPAFEPGERGFRPANAWLLCELARLVYLPGGEELRDGALEDRRSEHLAKVGLRETATFNRRSNHVSVFESEREGGFTVVCFRGTTSAKQWLLNLSTIPDSWGEGVHVHQGFKYLYEEIGPKLMAHLERAVRPVLFAGHSLGGALASLAASKFAPDVLYTFGAPRVGNSAFRDLLVDVPAYRVVNRSDIVTLLPHAVEELAPYDFRHCGLLIYLSEEGGMLVDPEPGRLPKENAERSEQPLTFLAKSFKSPHPPGCLIDHAPCEYAAQLERWL